MERVDDAGGNALATAVDKAIAKSFVELHNVQKALLDAADLVEALTKYSHVEECLIDGDDLPKDECPHCLKIADLLANWRQIAGHS